MMYDCLVLLRPIHYLQRLKGNNGAGHGKQPAAAADAADATITRVRGRGERTDAGATI